MGELSKHALATREGILHRVTSPETIRLGTVE